MVIHSRLLPGADLFDRLEQLGAPNKHRRACDEICMWMLSRSSRSPSISGMEVGPAPGFSAWAMLGPALGRAILPFRFSSDTLLALLQKAGTVLL